MTTISITVEATLQADGLTLNLAQRLALPPGRVTLTVQPSGTRTGPTALEVLDRIDRERQERGRKPMTEEEMNAEIARIRAQDDDYEERCRQIWSQTEFTDPKGG